MTTPSANLVRAVAAELRADIRSGRLRPGERIPQDAVARRHGTSRLPVREALRELASEGLVTLLPNVGARVAELNLADLREVFLIRERLEPLAASVAVGRIGADGIAELEQTMARLSAMTGSSHEFHELDRQFHFGIYRECGMPRLLKMIEQMWATSQQYRSIYSGLSEVASIDIAHAEHGLVLDAVRRRSAGDVAALLELHIRRTREALEAADEEITHIER